MRPILFRLGGIRVWSYPAFLYIGLVLGVVAGNAAAHREPSDPLAVFAVTFILLVPALIGARLLFVAMHWEEFRRTPRRIFTRSEGGAAQYGALVLILPLSVPVVRAFGISLGAFWDAASFTILVGMVSTRIGCLLNGCCAGRPSRWGVPLPNRAGVWERRVPTQPLEAALAMLLLLLGVVLQPRRPFDGAVFLAVASGYALGRLGLESVRDRPPRSARFTIHHAISLVLVVGCAAAFAVNWAAS